MGLFDKIFGRAKKDSTVDPPKNASFASSDKLMDEDQFWKIIQTTIDNSGDDFVQQKKELAKELRKLTPHDIVLFGNRFRYFRGQANTWELWGAIYIIHGGCGDNSFNDFREWVIGQGKMFYYKTTKDPESLVEVDRDKIVEADWEGLGNVHLAVFKELTGQQMEYLFKEKQETTGVEWKEDSDDLEKMFPKLYAKYRGKI